jgi:hypothetical protein
VAVVLLIQAQAQLAVQAVVVVLALPHQVQAAQEILHWLARLRATAAVTVFGHQRLIVYQAAAVVVQVLQELLRQIATMVALVVQELLVQFQELPQITQAVVVVQLVPHLLDHQAQVARAAVAQVENPVLIMQSQEQ